MKRSKLFSIMAGVVLTSLVTGCDEEKDLIVIHGNLPIKSSVLYMVGDATTCGWNIDDPVRFTMSEEDPAVFTWQGTLYSGELKLCLKPGSWDNAFIRPIEAGTAITTDPIVEAEFGMWPGDPDNKWIVLEEGSYRLTFDLKRWVMSSEYIGEAVEEEVTPLLVDALYIVGDATPANWNIEEPFELTKVSEYIFKYDGVLYGGGEMKAYTDKGSWEYPFIHPKKKTTVTTEGLQGAPFVISSIDNKWTIEETGLYEVTFDLEHFTIDIVYKGEFVIEQDPVETDILYLLGSALDKENGWEMDNLIFMAQDATNKYLFTWEGNLKKGELKAFTTPDKDYACPFVRPAKAGVTISSEGLSDPKIVYTTDPDDKWNVIESGRYKLSIDLRKFKAEATKIGDWGTPDTPIEIPAGALLTETLYMIGSATEGGWDMGKMTALTRDATNEYLFTWTGHLNAGEMKACVAPCDWVTDPFLRPSYANCEISKAGVASQDLVYTRESDGNNDDKWNVVDAGTYTITFDLANWQFNAVFQN